MDRIGVICVYLRILDFGAGRLARNCHGAGPLFHGELVSRRAVKPKLEKWFLILLCFSMAASIGGGLYEKLVLIPLWSASPPSSFAVIQPDTGVPLQNFWIPTHIAITVFVLLALFLNSKEPKVRRLPDRCKRGETGDAEGLS